VFLAGCEMKVSPANFRSKILSSVKKHFELKRIKCLYDVPKGILLFKTPFFLYGEHLTKTVRVFSVSMLCSSVLQHQITIGNK
jgi:hypothetical protein